MEFKQFCDYIEKNVVNYAPEELKSAKIQIVSVMKNGEDLIALTILPEDETVSPTLYLSTYYEQYLDGRGLGDIMKELVDLYLEYSNKAKSFSYVAEEYKCFDNIKHKIIMIPLNKIRNEAFLEQVPHHTFADFAMIYKVIIKEDKDTVATILIKNKDIAYWNVTEADLYKLALVNTRAMYPTIVYSLLDEVVNAGMMTESQKQEIEDSTPIEAKQYVVSNCTKKNGAIAMFDIDTLSAIATEVETNLYILPCSVHEVIVMSSNFTDDFEQLKSIVSEANNTILEPDEILSEHVFLFDNETKEINIIA